MNNRDYKKFAPGEYFHIYNRGNGKQQIFLDEEDFKFFIFRLRENLSFEFYEQVCKSQLAPYVRKPLPKDSFTLVSYTLMPNHFHLLVRQNSELPMSELVKKLCTGYAKHFNKKYGKVGSLFEHKFRAVHIENEEYLLWLSAYMHQNPKVAGLVDDLKDWPYSSYLDYVGERDGNLCDKSIILDKFPNQAAYKIFIDQAFEKIKSRKDIQRLLIDEDGD